MGNMAYEFLAREANVTSDQNFPDWLGYPPLPEDNHGGVGYLSPTSPSGSSATSPATMYVPTLIHFQKSRLTSRLRNVSPPFSPSPSPSSSQTSSDSENCRSSPKPSPTRKPNCGQALPVFNHIRGKWCCSVCDTGFRGRWECKRHINTTGKRSMCRACGGSIKGKREDSLRRHFTKYCKGNVGNFRFEDAFIEV